jgi:adenosylcobinamide amidohydrolase
MRRPPPQSAWPLAPATTGRRQAAASPGVGDPERGAAAGGPAPHRDGGAAPRRHGALAGPRAGGPAPAGPAAPRRNTSWPPGPTGPGAPRPTANSQGRGRELSIQRRDRLLLVDFTRPQQVVSWAIAGGGLGRTSTVAWLQVSELDLRPPVEPRSYLRRQLRAAGVTDAVGLLTSRDLDTYVDVARSHGSLTARCIATVGLGNALRAGDPPGPSGRIGTINLLCQVSVALTVEALLETLTLAAEARTLAIREADVPSQRSGAPASGTGTDCIVIAAPALGAARPYAGKHTALGHVIGAAVYDAVRSGAAAWQRERTAPAVPR